MHTQYVIDGSRRTCQFPSLRATRNLSPKIFVFRESHAYVVEAEEVALGRDDLAGELDGGLLAVADAEEDAQQLGVGEGAGPGLEQSLARAELRWELLYGVASSFQDYGVIGTVGYGLQAASLGGIEVLRL